MKYVSERIVNISELERILADILIKSQIVKSSSCESDRQELLCEIIDLANKGTRFEFNIERRITSLCSE